MAVHQFAGFPARASGAKSGSEGTKPGEDPRQFREVPPWPPFLTMARAQVSYSYLRAIEDGARVNPSAPLLARIAAVYGRSLDELFTDGTEPASAR